MADSSIDVDPGTGASKVPVNTETLDDGTDRQGVVIGDGALAANIAPVSSTAGLKVDLGTDNDVTVTGTVTANLSATDNAVLDTIDAVLDTINAKFVTGTVIGDVNLGATDNAVIDNIVTQLIAAQSAAIPAGTNLAMDVGISGTRTSGGTTLYRNVDVDESEDQIKGAAGQIYWIHAVNMKASVLYLQFYDALAASVTVGTTPADLTFPVPTQGDTNGAGFTLSIPNGIAFATGITIAATTGIADAGAPGANELFVNLGYA